MRKLNIIEYVNKKIGRLIILSFFIKDKKTYCVAQCECGVIKNYVFNSIKLGLTKSCGCIRKEKNNGQVFIYNTEFFKSLTSDASYVLGLLYTDGNICGTRFTIGLKEEDKDVLEKISILIKNASVLFVQSPRKSPTSNNFTQKHYVFYGNSKEIIKDLKNLGLYENKTHTIKPISLLENNKDFWRGCIDGDGWVSLYKKKHLIIGFGGTKEMVQGFSNFCFTFIDRHYKLQKRTDKNYYEVTISGKNAYKIHALLYDKSELFIKRKKFPDKFDSEKALNRDLESERKELSKGLE